MITQTQCRSFWRSLRSLAVKAAISGVGRGTLLFSRVRSTRSSLNELLCPGSPRQRQAEDREESPMIKTL